MSVLTRAEISAQEFAKLTDFTLNCGAPDCRRRAVEMALHATCGDAMAVCADHGLAVRRLLAEADREPAMHVTCNEPVTETSTTFRAI